MTPLMWALIIVGACAVITFVAYLVVGGSDRRQNPRAQGLLKTAGGLGIVCAVLGALIAVVDGN